VAVHEGTQRTLVEGVEVTRISKPVPRAPVVYQPKILIVGQGRKRAYLGGALYRYDAYNYLVLSVPMPAECETEASPEEPLLLMAINVEPTMLGEMMLEMDEPPPPVGSPPRGISTTPMSAELGGAVIRLLECLKSPLDSCILGRQTVREIVYRVLQGEQGGALRALASRDEYFSRIARVLKHVHAEYANPLSVEELARKAGFRIDVRDHALGLVTQQLGGRAREHPPGGSLVNAKRRRPRPTLLASSPTILGASDPGAFQIRLTPQILPRFVLELVIQIRQRAERLFGDLGAIDGLVRA